jgi:Domain of unknown function (DUF1877)
MSMIGNLRRLPDDDLRRLLDDPELIIEYLDEDSDDESFGPHADLEIDKSWHGIHFLLTKSAWEGELPLAFLVLGGHQIGDEDLGYGPARGFSSDEVHEIAEALEAIDVAELRRRFDPAAMTAAEIYPAIWDRPPAEDDTLGYLASYYGELRAFIAGAAAKDEAVLVYVN